MKCGIGKCGRCNVGPVYVCKDGPVFTAAQLKTLPAEFDRLAAATHCHYHRMELSACRRRRSWVNACTLTAVPISAAGAVDVWRPNCLCWTSEPLFHG